MAEEPIEDMVAHATMVAQAKGRPTMAEMASVLDNLIGLRTVDMRQWAKVHGPDIDWERWGRITYVLEEALALIRRIDGDKEAREFLMQRRRSTAKRESAPDGDSP